MFDLRAFFRPVDGLRLRKRLWKTGGVMALLVLTFTVQNQFLSDKKSVSLHDLGLDFLAFYYGGTCARTGHMDDIYNLKATKAFDEQTAKKENLNLGGGFGPFWNPPFVAWIFAPLSALPFRQALYIWWGFGLACVIAAIAMMCRMLGGDWTTWGLVPLFVFTCNPCIEAFTHGQNCCLSLLILVTTIVLWRAEQPLWAGLVCGLLFYKPQLGLVVAAVLWINQGKRAMAGILISAVGLLLITVITMPHALGPFLFDMPRNLRMMQESHPDYIWERHATLRTFWRILVQGWHTGPDYFAAWIGWMICEALLLAGLASVIFKSSFFPGDASERDKLDRLISATIVSMPLLMPFYFDYDLLLLAPALVLYVMDRRRNSGPMTMQWWEDRWLPRIWTAVFFMMQIAGPIAPHTRVHPLIPLLTVLAILHIRRGLRPLDLVAENAGEPPHPVALAA